VQFGRKIKTNKVSVGVNHLERDQGDSADGEGHTGTDYKLLLERHQNILVLTRLL
jgi:hypothetical protein